MKETVKDRELGDEWAERGAETNAGYTEIDEKLATLLRFFSGIMIIYRGPLPLDNTKSSQKLCKLALLTGAASFSLRSPRSRYSEKACHF